MDKKGVLAQFMLLFTILLISMAIAIFFNAKSETYNFDLGEVQGEIIRGYMEVDSQKFYLENNFEKDSERVINDIISSGGLDEPILKGGYVLWKKGNTEYFPTSWSVIKDELAKRLVKEVGDYDYEIVRKGAKTNISFESEVSFFSERRSAMKNFEVSYSEPVKGSVEYDFNFDNFLSKAREIERVSGVCGENETCWRTSSSVSLVDVKDKLFKLEFTTLGLDGDKTVKVAVDFDPN
jgi:hypothetical protein